MIGDSFPSNSADDDSQNEARRTAALRLALIPGVGPRIRQLLLEYFGEPANVLAAPLSELRNVQGVGPKLGRVIVEASDTIDVKSLELFCYERGIEILTESSADYPRSLREIVDPPGVLFMRGKLRPTDALAIAIVGTRHATMYGKQQAERLAAGLARAGMTVVSGLARGIDAAAHRGALQAGGRTLAILGSGVSNIYPPEHKELASELVASGALLSESPPESPPLAGAFPQRNRIITGMSLGVIVVEAALRSGALISARHAMEQGRDRLCHLDPPASTQLSAPSDPPPSLTDAPRQELRCKSRRNVLWLQILNDCLGGIRERDASSERTVCRTGFLQSRTKRTRNLLLWGGRGSPNGLATRTENCQ